MPILSTFALPEAPAGLNLPGETLFVAFISSDDAATKKPWCPDVRAAMPHITSAFEPESQPTLAIAQSGTIPEWRNPANPFRTTWNVQNIPTLVRFQRIGGEIKETGRLVESEILRKDLLEAFTK
ncbi:hypothetical protein B0I35DRAFT_406022 [Stachybotrys elegans]|uniref:Thioredoxin domain-containing protein n=1 Tax=Stachybotrys elegans TaxID=80388 RepID=A0A8K0WV87_9HYPO|nr:hypothetical protein B0I35DRAFT_406022 [Stachybotrys elegans]